MAITHHTCSLTEYPIFLCDSLFGNVVHYVLNTYTHIYIEIIVKLFYIFSYFFSLIHIGAIDHRCDSNYSRVSQIVFIAGVANTSRLIYLWEMSVIYVTHAFHIPNCLWWWLFNCTVQLEVLGGVINSAPLGTWNRPVCGLSFRQDTISGELV